MVRASLSLPGLPLVQPPPGSPGSFAWLKVHAHRAQLGCRVRGACSLQDQRPSAGGTRPGRRWVPRGPGFRAGSVGPQTSLGRTAVPREPIRPARACMTQHDLAQAPTQAQRKPRLGGARVRSQAQLGPWPIILPLPLLSCLPLSGSPPLRRAHGRAGPTQHGRVPQCANPQQAGRRARTCACARTHKHTHTRTHTHTHSLSSGGHGARLSRPAARD